MNLRHGMLGVALVIAAGIAFLGDRSPASDAIVAQDRTPTVASNDASRSIQIDAGSAAGAKSSLIPAPLIELVPREFLMKSRSANEPANLFSAYASHQQQTTASVTQTGAATSTFSYKYLGRRTKGDGWEVFLEKDDTIVIATTSEMVGDDYKIVSITASEITVEFVPTHDKTILTIE